MAVQQNADLPARILLMMASAFVQDDTQDYKPKYIIHQELFNAVKI